MGSPKGEASQRRVSAGGGLSPENTPPQSRGLDCKKELLGSGLGGSSLEKLGRGRGTCVITAPPKMGCRRRG